MMASKAHAGGTRNAMMKMCQIAPSNSSRGSPADIRVCTCPTIQRRSSPGKPERSLGPNWACWPPPLEHLVSRSPFHQQSGGYPQFMFYLPSAFAASFEHFQCFHFELFWVGSILSSVHCFSPDVLAYFIRTFFVSIFSGEVQMLSRSFPSP